MSLHHKASSSSVIVRPLSRITTMAVFSLILQTIITAKMFPNGRTGYHTANKAQIHCTTSGITESSTDPPTHRPYHRPTW